MDPLSRDPEAGSPTRPDRARDEKGRYAEYLLELRDELDRLEARPTTRLWLAAGFSSLGVLVSSMLLIRGAPPQLLIEFILVALVPLGYVLHSVRRRDEERAKLMRRIHQIESRSEEVDADRP